MKYSIIMPYVDRLEQLRGTLESFRKWYHARTDYDVILVVDDKTKDKEQLVVLLSEYKDLPVRAIDPIPGTWHSPGPHYNVGAKNATGQFVVLTCPECLHAVDVLAGVDKLLSEDFRKYIVCACKAEGAAVPWYQHSVHRPSCYHFCSVLLKDTYWSVGGFSPLYGAGVAYDDNDFRDSLIVAKVPFVQADDLLTIHQAHPHAVNGPQRRALLHRNREIYLQRCAERGLPCREN